jgi:nucleotide-binding universal stress UspA family protein
VQESERLKNVVVAIDERDHSRHAVAVGMDLAERFGATLDLVHAVPREDYVSMRDWSEIDLHLASSARDRCASRLAEAFPDDAERLAERLVALRGAPGHVLLSYTRNHATDLLILGGHEKHGIFDFGGTARAVLHKSPCPVWVQPGSPSKIERIVVPTDMSEPSGAILAWARTLATVLDARVRVAHWFEPPYFAYEALHSDNAPTYTVDALRAGEEQWFRRFVAAFDWKDISVDVHFGEGEPLGEILDDQQEGDLVVMGTHGRSGWARAVLGSVAYGVLKASKAPVLAIPFEDEWLEEHEVRKVGEPTR